MTTPHQRIDRRWSDLFDDGCDRVINRRAQDYVAEVERVRGPQLTCFAAGGDQAGSLPLGHCRWVTYGYAAGESFSAVDVSPITYDGIAVMPVSSLARSGTEDEATAQRFPQGWIANEELIEPQIRPLSKVTNAPRAMEADETTDKVVFTTNDGEH